MEPDGVLNLSTQDHQKLDELRLDRLCEQYPGLLIPLEPETTINDGWVGVVISSLDRRLHFFCDDSVLEHSVLPILMDLRYQGWLVAACEIIELHSANLNLIHPCLSGLEFGEGNAKTLSTGDNLTMPSAATLEAPASVIPGSVDHGDSIQPKAITDIAQRLNWPESKVLASLKDQGIPTNTLTIGGGQTVIFVPPDAIEQLFNSVILPALRQDFLGATTSRSQKSTRNGRRSANTPAEIIPVDGDTADSDTPAATTTTDNLPMRMSSSFQVHVTETGKVSAQATLKSLLSALKVNDPKMQVAVLTNLGKYEKKILGKTPRSLKPKVMESLHRAAKAMLAQLST